MTENKVKAKVLKIKIYINKTTDLIQTTQDPHKKAFFQRELRKATFDLEKLTK